MKGMQGIMVAFGLGVAGALCNWFYINRLAHQEVKITFIGIASGAQLNVGDQIQPGQVVPVQIPRSGVGNLDQAAPLWEYRSTVIGQRTSRSFRGGEIVLQQDLTTPAARELNEKLGPNEVALWIPIDGRSVSSSRMNPDDEVSFIAPKNLGTAEARPSEPGNASTNEIIGPFRILEIGSRTGRPEVQRASGNRGGNEGTITIVVRLEGGKLEPKAERVMEVMRISKSQGLQVILHPKKKNAGS